MEAAEKPMVLSPISEPKLKKTLFRLNLNEITSFPFRGTANILRKTYVKHIST